MKNLCPCGSGMEYKSCCELIHLNVQAAQSAEQLMRARYSAYVKHNIDFIYQTFHPQTRRFQSQKTIAQWATENKWMGLEIIHATKQTVEFKAHYLDAELKAQEHHEKSTFKQSQGIWYFVDGQ